VEGIRVVELEVETPEDKVTYKSDYYSEWTDGSRKQAIGEMAKKYKVEGLYFSEDADVKAKYHLPPGLTGLKEAIKVAREHLANGDTITYFSIGVIWSFVGDASCSDYIKIVDGETTLEYPRSLDDTFYSSYDNQDWWIRAPGYIEHCRKLSELLNSEVRPYEDAYDTD